MYISLNYRILAYLLHFFHFRVLRCECTTTGMDISCRRTPRDLRWSLRGLSRQPCSKRLRADKFLRDTCNVEVSYDFPRRTVSGYRMTTGGANQHQGFACIATCCAQEWTVMRPARSTRSCLRPTAPTATGTGTVLPAQGDALGATAAGDAAEVAQRGQLVACDNNQGNDIVTVRIL